MRGAFAWVLAIVFGGLAALHVYWASGGARGMKAVIPKVDGAPTFRPGTATTLVVAALLAAAGLLVLERAGAGPGLVPPVFARVGAWGVAGVLTLRAVGNFDTVGFFKRRRATLFARLDTRIFSPLALALGLAAGVIARGG